MEGLLMGKDQSVATRQFLHSNYLGRLLFAHKLNIYLTSVQETQLRLYDELERVLREFLSAVEILSRGYLPASLFPLPPCSGLLPMHCKWSKRKTLTTSSQLNMSQSIMT